MNDKGDILPKELVQKLSPEEQTKFIEIPEDRLESVLKMNRVQRRAFYKSQRPQRKEEARKVQEERNKETK